MANGTKQTETRTIEAPANVLAYLRSQGNDADPKMLLELAMAETERTRAVAASHLAKAKSLAEVVIGPDGLLSASNMAGMMEVAEALSFSDFTPKRFQNKKYNCLIACTLSIPWKVSPFMVMQHLFMVNDTPGISAQLAIAVANTSGLLEGILTSVIDGDGDDRTGTATGKIKASGQIIHYPVSMRTAIAEGWTRNTKWKSMRDDMLDYRCKAWWIRHNIPQVLLGIPLVDEIEDVAAVESVGAAPVAKPATNRVAAFTEELKSPKNGHKAAPKPEPLDGSTETTSAPVNVPADLPSKVSDRDEQHAKEHGGELPFGGEDQSAPPSKAEMWASENPKPTWPASDKHLSECDKMLTAQPSLDDIDLQYNGFVAEHFKNMKEPARKTASALFSWHRARVKYQLATA